MYLCPRSDSICTGALWPTYSNSLGVPVNGSATISCYTVQSATQWTRKGQVVVDNGQLLDNATDRLNFSCIYTRCDLTILSATYDDSGEYRCSSFHFMITYRAQVLVLGTSWFSRVNLVRNLRLLFSLSSFFLLNIYLHFLFMGPDIQNNESNLV